MMKKALMILFAILMIGKTEANGESERLFDVKIHGFVAVDAAHNSRIGREVRSKRIYMYPAPKLIENNTDMHRRGRYDMDASHSRFGVHINGPTINGVSFYGLMEADFLGDARVADSNFRLRHAFVRMNFQNYSLLAGQYWHPFFIPENLPQTVNTATGAPMHPLSRNPQIRFTYHGENLELVAALIEQHNFRTAGFVEGSEYSERPEITVQAKIGGSGPAWLSLSAGYKTLAMPDMKDVNVSSAHYQATFRYRLPNLTARGGVLYAENATEMVVPGGIGLVKGRSADNPKYKPLATSTFWTDLSTNHTQWVPGLFVGYLKAMGASSKVDVVDDMTFDAGVTNVVTIAPRIRYFFSNAIWVGAEYMFTQAGWGQDDNDDEYYKYDEYGAPDNIKYYNNHRMLISLRYTF